MKSLTQAQMEVMKWLGKKWSAQPSHGTVWTINGGSHRQGVTCTSRTLKALERKHLTKLDEHGCWIATETGKQLVRDLEL